MRWEWLPNKPLKLPAAGFSQSPALPNINYGRLIGGRSLAAIRWAATVLETINRLTRRAALYGAIIVSAPSAAARDPLSCATWITMNTGDRAVALRAGTETSVETVRPIFAGMHNEKAILDSVQACMQASEPAFLAAFNDLCASNPDADRDAFLSRMAPISRHCAEEAINLTD